MSEVLNRIIPGYRWLVDGRFLKLLPSSMLNPFEAREFYGTKRVNAIKGQAKRPSFFSIAFTLFRTIPVLARSIQSNQTKLKALLKVRVWTPFHFGTTSMGRNGKGSTLSLLAEPSKWFGLRVALHAE